MLEYKKVSEKSMKKDLWFVYLLIAKRIMVSRKPYA